MVSIADVLGLRGRGGITFSIFLLILGLFFLVSGAVIFGESWGAWQSITIIYLFFIMGSFILAPAEFAQSRLRDYIIYFSVTTAIVGTLFAALFKGFPALGRTYLPVPIGLVGLTLLFQYFITQVEELFFRQGLLGRKIGIIPAAALFAGFHYALFVGVLGSPPLALFTLAQPLILGIVLGYIYLTVKAGYNPGAAMGVIGAAHLMFNASILGINPFAALIGGQ